MEQRASALQQRLEARRNMFLKSDGGGANNSTYGANRPITTGPTSLPSSAPPQPPTSVPRNVKDALNILNSSNNSVSKTNGDSSEPSRKFSTEK